MEESDNVRVFAAEAWVRYNALCELYAVTALPISLDQVIAHTVTSNMNQTAKALYYDDLREDSEKITIEMEKSLYDHSFRRSLFNHAKPRSEPRDNAMSPSCQTNQPSWNHHQCRQSYVPNGLKRHRSYRGKKCWFFPRGLCHFGESCWNEHI